MRNSAGILFPIFLLLLSFNLQAEGFRVFEKDGYFGVLSPSGEVSIPAVYHQLGWSDGSSVIQNGVIGFKEGSLWGLISVKNKILAAPKFYTIELIGGGYIKASVKGNFSNRLFYGLLDTKGNVQISFNHFSIDALGANWLVSDFEQNRQSFGLISFSNQLLIPKAYQKISATSGLLQAQNHSADIDLYNSEGKLLHAGIDSLRGFAQGWKVYRDGYAGFLRPKGQLWIDFIYKAIDLAGNEPQPVSFPTWRIYEKGNLRLESNCDSITVTAGGRLLAYLNGAHHLLVEDSMFQHNPEFLIREVSEGHFIVQNSKTRKWSVLTQTGNTVLKAYDSIYATKRRYVLKKNGMWLVATREGKLLNNRPLQQVRKGLDRQMIAKRNGYWGVLDEGLMPVSPFKYDSIGVLGSYYLVFYLNGYGLMTEAGNWLLKANYDQVYNFGSYQIGRKRNAFTYFIEGREVYYSTHEPLQLLGEYLLLASEEGKLGLMNAYGEIRYDPVYDEISFRDGYLIFRKGANLQVLDREGSIVIDFEEGYTYFEGFSEEYSAVRKDSRYGFVDEQGKLRISNRYEKARSFSEGLAPVILRSRWGFIDKAEQVSIQPHYQKVSGFVDGISIVADASGYGLVDKSGHEVMKLGWKEIVRLSTGNFLIRNIQGKLGLVNKNGKFLLRPDFEYLQDLGQSVIVAKNGSWGILQYDGVTVVEMNHKKVEVVNKLTLIKD